MRQQCTFELTSIIQRRRKQAIHVGETNYCTTRVTGPSPVKDTFFQLFSRFWAFEGDSLRLEDMTQNLSPRLKVPQRRFFLCTLSTILLVAGTLLLVGAIALYVLWKVTTGKALPNSETYRQRTLYHQPTDASQVEYDFHPITIIIVLAALAAALITFGSIGAIIACTACSNKSSSTKASRGEHVDSEEEVEGKREEHQLTPLIDLTQNERLKKDNRDRSTPAAPQGDINTIGLPETVPETNFKRVPRNGFTYLANPLEIHSYHKNRETPQVTVHELKPSIESTPRQRLESSI